jgi:hypothetical protein
MRTLRYVAFLLCASLSTALCAKASPTPTDPPIFGLSESSGTTSFAAGTGIGQAVSVSESMSINDFGFYLNQVPSGTVDFFIYDSTRSSLTLAPQVVSAPTRGWDYLTGLDVDLNGGDQYYFGVYGTGMLYVGSDTTSGFFTDGLGIPGGLSPSGAPLGVSSLDFTGDTPTGKAGPEDITLRIYSTDPPGETPEPSSLMLLGSGILAGAGILRRKFVR